MSSIEAEVQAQEPNSVPVEDTTNEREDDGGDNRQRQAATEPTTTATAATAGSSPPPRSAAIESPLTSGTGSGIESAEENDADHPHRASPPPLQVADENERGNQQDSAAVEEQYDEDEDVMIPPSPSEPAATFVEDRLQPTLEEEGEEERNEAGDLPRCPEIGGSPSSSTASHHMPSVPPPPPPAAAAPPQWQTPAPWVAAVQASARVCSVVDSIKADLQAAAAAAVTSGTAAAHVQDVVLQDVDEVLRMCMPRIIKGAEPLSEQQMLQLLLPRVLEQLDLPRFRDKHLKVLADQFHLAQRLEPVLDSELDQVAAAQTPQ